MERQSVEILFLSEEETIEAGVLNMPRCVQVIDETFQLTGQGDYLMGGPNENSHGVKLFFPLKKRSSNMPEMGPDRRFMALVGYLGGRFNICGEKYYGSNIENLGLGLPRSIHLVILNDPVTGQPLTIMAGNLISAMRTGAVAGVGIDYVACKDAETIGIVGCGVISNACLRAFLAVMKNIQHIKVYDLKAEKSQRFSQEIQNEFGIKVSPVDSLKKAVCNTDIVNIAAAGPNCPKVKTEWLKEGSVLSLPADTYLEEETLQSSRIVIDEWNMHLARRKELEQLSEEDPRRLSIESPADYLHSLVKAGSIQEEDIYNLGKIAIGQQKGREDRSERVVLIMGGMVVQDLSWGYTVYEEALQKGLGQRLKLWEGAHWL